MRKVIAVLAIITGLIGCKRDNAVEPAPYGKFQYKAYDSSGTLVVEGWMTLAIQDTARITGAWHLTKVDDPQNIGPQLGDGELVGEFHDGSVLINLNPGFADNNVFLSGQFAADTFSGTWNWSGFAGILNRGNFQARRQ